MFARQCKLTQLQIRQITNIAQKLKMLDTEDPFKPHELESEPNLYYDLESCQKSVFQGNEVDRQRELFHNGRNDGWRWQFYQPISLSVYPTPCSQKCI